MEVRQYADWSLGVHERLSGQRVPFGGVMEVTRRCNNRCLHCYNNLPINDQAARNGELSYEEHCRILDEITAAGCLWLLFTGGEIFVRKDFIDIYAYAHQKGLLITLFSNGTLITPEIADYLVQQCPFCIEITLYGRTPKTYEQITGMPGSFDSCMRGIRLLMKRKLPLKLKTMATTINKDEIWQMKRFVEDELGLDFKFDAMINPRCDWSQGPLDVRLSPAEVVELDLKDPVRVEEWKTFADKFSTRSVSQKPADVLWQCGGGQNSFAVDPDGMLRMCVLSATDAYDLRPGSFQQGWERFLYNMRQKKITRLTKCVACQIKAMCGMCPANAELECMDAEAPVDFLCQVAHLRAYAFGIHVAPHGDCSYCKGGRGYEDMMNIVARMERTG